MKFIANMTFYQPILIYVIQHFTTITDWFEKGLQIEKISQTGKLYH